MALEPQFSICSLRSYSRLMIHQPYVYWLPTKCLFFHLSIHALQTVRSEPMSLSSLLAFSSSSGPSTGTCSSLTCLNQISRLLSKSSCAVDRARLLPALVSAKVLMLSLCFNHVATVFLGRSSLLHMIDGLTPPLYLFNNIKFLKNCPNFSLFSGRHDCSRLTGSSVHYG